MKACRWGGRRGSAMIQVMMVMVVVFALSGSMVKLAAFSVRSAERRIRRAQCEVLAESVCGVLQAAWSGDTEDGPELPEEGVYDLGLEDFPGEIVVECMWKENSKQAYLSVCVTAAVREVSGAASFQFVPDRGKEGDDEDGEEREETDWDEESPE